MSLSIQNHKLGGKILDKEVEYDPCEGKDSGAFTGDYPDTVVIHYTGGSSMAGAVDTLKNPKIEASAHLVIDRDGSIKQLIGFDRIAWHAGKSRWNGRKGINRYSIGIELVNAGELKPSGEQYVSWFGHHYQQNDVIEAVHRNQSAPSFWHTYTEEQIEVCFEVCRILKETYPVTLILGHEEISPGRKIDPGPAFPLDKMRDQILEGRADAEEVVVADTAGKSMNEFPIATVKANLLNFREQPYKSALMAGEPLPFGKRVEVLERSGEWCKVRVSQDGWVHGDYIQQES